MPLADLLITAKGTWQIIADLCQRSAENRGNIINVVNALNLATTTTRQVLNNAKGAELEPQLELVALWTEAYKLVEQHKIYAENEFPNWVYTKIQFWRNPRASDTELIYNVATLSQMEEMCDQIQAQLSR